MLSYVYYEDVFLEKQKYNHEKDESFSIQIAKILIVFFVLFLLWNGYSHYKQIDLIRNGTPVLAEVSVIGNDKYISFTAEDGKSTKSTFPVCFWLTEPMKEVPVLSSSLTSSLRNRAIPSWFTIWKNRLMQSL